MVESTGRGAEELGFDADDALRSQFPASTVGISIRTRRRSVGFRRDLVRWIRDFERNPRSPYLLDLVKSLAGAGLRALGGFRTFRQVVSQPKGVPCCQELAIESLFELDRDTLHTRLGSAHECHSGVRLCAFALVSLMPVGLALYGPLCIVAEVDRRYESVPSWRGIVRDPLRDLSRWSRVLGRSRVTDRRRVHPCCGASARPEASASPDLSAQLAVLTEVIKQQSVLLQRIYEIVTQWSGVETGASVQQALLVGHGVTPVQERTMGRGLSRRQHSKGLLQQGPSPRTLRCVICGGPHWPRQCEQKEGHCYTCGQPGHVRSTCARATFPALSIASAQPADQQTFGAAPSYRREDSSAADRVVATRVEVPRSSDSTPTTRREAVRGYGWDRSAARKLGEASTVGISIRTRRRSVGFRRDLVRWIRDFERNPRSPYLLDLVKSLFELDRDTLHTRLGSAHECHSGVRLCAFALVSLMPVGLALYGPSHRFWLLHRPRTRIEARAPRVRALLDVLS
uniref:CCHC-type domain-containing protein n=1 Tax=Ananas comosus var. bracteatus TaxID=296719 RepID=A0A6V7P5Q5_ANACO|nr:unnamed protein product [Ananas comosus var. bracteatus]